ncbi:hypothetical protein CB0940_09041 [Cercospora beticola]|uniref:Uncharacterized protein n=1 Tax=Cercospora beticola TaxID=122368 RepID=A0A2G5HG50_CERBT|nr:hypothetical protein CB0940_09041 [Cercospora beticola]PIA91566.1 hypothetical protein CB0940_09041 [Cercospora beticola]WPB06684.1 hypothetical protein RHO25_011343 [Cercospora beticola]
MPSHSLWREDMIEGSDREEGRLPDGLDSYWRLDSYKNVSSGTLVNALRDAGDSNHPLHWLSKVSLRARYQRVIRRLLCYDACSIGELRIFVQARGLEVETHREKERTSLERALEKGDTELSFHRIMDLPAELRLNIYEFYICDFSEELHEPTQPPLARTNQQIRKEFLPVFYTNHEILLKMTFDAEKDYDLRWDKGTDYFVKSLEPSSLAMLRKINITVREDFRGRGSRIDTDLFHFRIELGGPNRDCSVKLTQSIDDEIEYPDFSDSYEFEDDPKTLEEEIQATFEVARSRTQDKTP